MNKMKFSNSILSVLLMLLVAICSFSNASRILVAAPSGTKSHQNMFVPLVKELARRGHHVTVISNYAASDFRNSPETIREIIIDKLALDVSIFPNMFEYMLSPWSIETVKETIAMMATTSSLSRDVAPDAIFDDPQVRDLIANDKFDLVLISEASSIFGYQFGWHFKTPIIACSPNALMPGRATQLGDDEHYSYVPFIMSSYSDKMTLYQRTMTLIFSKFFSAVFFRHYPEIWSKVEAKKLFNQLPPFEEMAKNVSIFFTNTHPSFSYPRTLPPQVIEVGGLHCRPARPLPKVFYLISILICTI